jgi:hypothetical protein
MKSVLKKLRNEIGMNCTNRDRKRIPIPESTQVLEKDGK